MIFYDEAMEHHCPHCAAPGLFWELRTARYVLVDADGNAHAPHCAGSTADPSSVLPSASSTVEKVNSK